jgi:hypothetical protein
MSTFSIRMVIRFFLWMILTQSTMAPLTRLFAQLRNSIEMRKAVFCDACIEYRQCCFFTHCLPFLTLAPNQCSGPEPDPVYP